MHESIRAAGSSRPRLTQPTSEDWYDLRRYVVATRVASMRRTAPESDGSAGRSG